MEILVLTIYSLIAGITLTATYLVQLNMRRRIDRKGPIDPIDVLLHTLTLTIAFIALASAVNAIVKSPY